MENPFPLFRFGFIPYFLTTFDVKMFHYNKSFLVIFFAILSYDYYSILEIRGRKKLIFCKKSIIYLNNQLI